MRVWRVELKVSTLDYLGLCTCTCFHTPHLFCTCRPVLALLGGGYSSLLSMYSSPVCKGKYNNRAIMKVCVEGGGVVSEGVEGGAKVSTLDYLGLCTCTCFHTPHLFCTCRPVLALCRVHTCYQTWLPPLTSFNYVKLH